MFELQSFSNIRGKWLVTRLCMTRQEAETFRTDRVNPNWQTRIVEILTGKGN